MRKRADVGRRHRAGIGQQTIRQLAASAVRPAPLSPAQDHDRCVAGRGRSRPQSHRRLPPARCRRAARRRPPSSSTAHPGRSSRHALPWRFAAFAAGRRLIPVLVFLVVLARWRRMLGQRCRDTAGAVFGRRQSTLRQPSLPRCRFSFQFLLQRGNPGAGFLSSSARFSCAASRNGSPRPGLWCHR